MNKAITLNNSRLEFCEPIYYYNNYIPQFISTLGHFPYFPIFLLLTNFLYFNKLKINFVKIQTTLQLVTMAGHMVINPYLYYIPLLSSLLTIYWMYNFILLNTSDIFKPNLNNLIFILSIVYFNVYFFGLLYSIFINFMIFILILNYNNYCNKLHYFYKKLIFSLFCTSFTLLGLELTYCNNLVIFPWHVLFDIMFWQISGSIILLSLSNKYFIE